MDISYEELCELIKQEMEDEWREMLEDERGGVSGHDRRRMARV